MKLMSALLWVATATLTSSAIAQNFHPLPYQSPDKSLGTVTCASSLCHGSIIEWKGSNVLQNEYVTWSRLDKHANKAYQILFNDRSARIVKNLGLAKPAHQEKLCLDCHSHNIPAAKQGERFKFGDGISCEACHGPAERYVKSHVEPKATHAQNIENGLYPLSDPTARAKVCLSCHWGNQDKFVTHRIMGAGHPRMSFELETFSMTAPAHFRLDKDYEERKRPWDGVKVWAIGQALAVAEMMDILSDPKRGRDGIFPELVLFDCHACHHPMSDLRWTPKTAFGASPGPGVARLNDSNMLMLRAIARQIDASLGQEINDQVLRLHHAASGKGDINAEAAKLKQMALGVTKRIEGFSFNEKALRGVAVSLVDEGLGGNFNDYAAAEQAAMALGSVVNYLNKRGLLGNTAALNKGLAKVQASLSNDEKFKPAEFQAAMKEFRVLVAGR